MRQLNALGRLLLASTALIPLGLIGAQANPLQPNVVGGSASVSGTGTAHVIVNQTTDRAIIDWRSFNIGVNERTQFVQPNASSIALNRVTGGLGPSVIDGRLDANGRVFLVNPDGMLFGAGARINTAGFLATTSNITNADFMAGRYNFSIPGRPDASIVNQGTITAHSGGFAALVAPGVRNSGTITANLGTVGLASANAFSLDFYGDRLITLGVDDKIAATVKDVATGLPLDALVKNEGKLRANGGRVELSAVSARIVVDSVINTSGVIEARSIGRRNGMIVLGAATAGTKLVGAPVQNVRVSGKLDVSSRRGKGGTIKVTGEDIKLANAKLDASGKTGGGTVLIGGDVGGGKGDAAAAGIAQAALESKPVPTATNVSVDAASTIDVSARQRGNGGKAVVWADGSTTFAGTIKGTGGRASGNGGFAEVSGRLSLAFYGTANLTAAKGSYGTLLLDPADYYIAVSETQAPPGASFMSASVLSTQLASSNVIIATDDSQTVSGQKGDIFVNGKVEWSSGTTLTLSAYRHITAATQSDQPVLVNTGAGNLVMRADSTGTGVGRVDFLGASAPVDFSGSTGKVSIFYNPNNGNYATPTNYAPAVLTNGAISGQMMAYMLVNNGAQLQNLGVNPIGYYALGRDIDFGTGVGGNFTPLSSFGGVLDGQGKTIRHLRIMPADTSTADIGLFSRIDLGGVVRDLTIADATVLANAQLASSTRQNVGLLAGRSAGLIENVSVSGTLDGSLADYIFAGGLVGSNGTLSTNGQVGFIKNSHSSVDVTLGQASTYERKTAGGLVGENPGRIESSSADGQIVVGDYGTAGGLVGVNGVFSGSMPNSPVPSIFGSSSSAVVLGYGSALTLGGLVGLNAPDGRVEYSTALTQVVGSSLGTSASCAPMCSSRIGGLVGINQGLVSETSVSAGSVVAGGDNAVVGGLVGNNFGRIEWSVAAAAVSSMYAAGGLVGINAHGAVVAQSFASGVVAVPGGSTGVSPSIGGGLVGGNAGRIEQSASNASVFGDGGFFGGLVGANVSISFGQNAPVFGTIYQAYATGPVTNLSTGAAGGLVGLNNGDINQTYATGLVSGTVAGGLVGTAAPGQYFDGLSTRIGTTTNSYWDTRSTGQATSAGGIGRTTAQLTAALPDGFDHTVWTIQPGVTYPYALFQPINTIPIPDTIPVDPPPVIPDVTVPTGVIPALETILANTSGQTVQQVNLLTNNPPPPPDNAPVIQLTTPPAPPPGPSQPGTGQQPGGSRQGSGPATGGPVGVPTPYRPLRDVAGFDGERFSSVPPINETRFISNEVVLQVGADVSPAEVARVAQQLGLVVLAQQNLDALGRNAYRFQFSGGRTIRDVIRALEQNRIVAVAQPNYTYRLSQPAEPAASSQTQSLPPAERIGDPSQYISGKFHLSEAHRIAGGNGVIVAVIDSQVDKDHVELLGAISQGYDAVGVPETAHPHGTAMAGAIVSRDRLLGVAPRARILAVSAFSDSQTSAEGTSFSILKGINWAVANGARIINMSFAGPYDPSLQRTLKLARDKGVVLIAAAGNAGPKSPPLYPGADPSVIAVTATDTDDKLFRMANRGPQVAFAAPGVDIIAPAPAAGYQMSTGTSIATAHVSGVVALMLERDPMLTPDDVRQILETTATDLGPKGRDPQFGWGLVNPHKALMAVALRQAARTRATQ